MTKIINVSIRKSKYLNSRESAFVTFSYNTEVLKMVKTISGRCYVPDEKSWEIPVEKVGCLKRLFPNDSIFVHHDKLDIKIPKDYHYKLPPYKYQEDGILYGLNHDRFILGDTQGIGKTMQSLHIAAIKKNLYNQKHCLIVCCINGLKGNWIREIEEHTNLSGYILGTRFKRNGEKKPSIGLLDKIEDVSNLDNIQEHFIVTNSESFRDTRFADLVRHNILLDKISMVIIDEVHKIVEENLINKQKVIIYSNWSEVVKVAKDKLSENNINSVTITRETLDKMSEIDKFRNGNEFNVIIGTIASLGTGYSLPEANTIIFLDSPYTDSDRQQSIDRAHRLTTKHSITIIAFVCEGTVDERVEEIVNQKVEITDLLVNGKMTEKGLTYLLS